MSTEKPSDSNPMSGSGDAQRPPSTEGVSHDAPLAEDPSAVILPKPLYPVFYDAERRRWPWFLRGLITMLFLFTLGLVLLIISVIALPLMPRTRLPKVVAVTPTGNADPVLKEHERRQLNFKQERERKQLDQLTEKTRKARHDRDLRALEFLRREEIKRAALVKETTTGNSHTLKPAPVPANASPIVAGFYVNWEETSRASTRRNISNLTHFIPEWLHLKPAGSDFNDTSPKVLPFVDARQPYDKTELPQLVRSNGVAILPLLNNFTQPKGTEEGVGNWDPQAVHQIIASPATRANFIVHLRQWLLAEQMQGVNIDFEEIQPADRDNLTLFMKELYAAFHPHGLVVTQDLQVENDSYDLAGLAQWNDWVIPMFYDQHTEESDPGPVAGVDWTRTNLNVWLSKIPAGKIVMGVGNHGYDWTLGQHGADSITYQSAVITAKESQPDAVIHLDPTALNPTFTYTDTVTDGHGNTQDQKHVVWMEDAVSVYNQLRLAKPHGVRGAALWYMGSEDPSIWSFLSRSKWNLDWAQLIEQGALNKISYGSEGGEGQVDFEGEGELLQPLVPPSDGQRDVTLDPKSGMVTAEAYQKDANGSLLLPSSYVIRRYAGSANNVSKQIVLSFDDGPDETWTPKILDILKAYHVPAVFFVVGRQGEGNPDLIRREFAEGHEIGNHSWTHPDLFKLQEEHRRLELTTTQRLIQAITGRSTILFRPPFGGDTEPETGREVSPLLTAATLNYITVGESNDPQDWRLHELKPGTETEDPTRWRTADEIVQSVVVNRDVGSVVLLHDAGGDRSRTVAALPRIIQELRSRGYTFVSVAQLSGIAKSKLMPPITGNDLVLAGGDRYVFEVTYLFQRTLTTLFTLSILLGVSRTVMFLVLALIQRYREQRRVFPTGFTPTVSVIIAAYNEEKVINNTIRALLESDYPNLEVIVVDDGSRDRTSEVVQEEFGNEPRVRQFRKENGGKASALNRGIVAATGEIVVSLDADTLFAPDTIGRLVRHFANPKVGAVSGNVRVGNTHNLLTRWQSLEYITSQNFDRRGYDLLNCITVVPGAVGALRRSAVLEIGGYTHDTLAEDTDVTWKLRRAGWRIVNDNSAMAYTEAPETLKNLAKQRFRWAFGTLQCLWKHQAALGQHGAFGWVALPSLWLYQILFPAISPFMDIAMVWSLFAGNFLQFAEYYLLMVGIEVVAAFIALRMDKGNMALLPWLFLQRFVYRQLMYYVILKSIYSAVRGGAVGWNKLERTGSARIEGKTT